MLNFARKCDKLPGGKIFSIELDTRTFPSPAHRPNGRHDEISSVSDFEFDVCGIMNRIICEMRTDFNKFPKIKGEDFVT